LKDTISVENSYKIKNDDFEKNELKEEEKGVIVAKLIKKKLNN
jgi:hypothetical protein